MEPVPLMPALEMTRRKATISDVARRAGIGKATASRALSGNGSISPGTREAVLRAAKELNFEANPLARSLSGGRSQKLVGMFALNLDLGIGTQKVQFIQMQLGAAGYDVPLYAYSHSVLGDELNQGNLLGALCRQRPRAIIFKSGNLDCEAIERLREYAADGGILVSYNHESEIDCDQVIFDESAAMEQAVAHCVALGHRKIGLRQHGGHSTSNLTYKGFRRGLEAAGLPLREEWVWFEGSYEEGGYNLAESFAAQAPEERPTAICIINDSSAATFVGEMIRRGFDVPGDVSVVSFGGMAAARYGFKPLTTVTEPVQEIASRVTELLRNRLEKGFEGPPQRVVYRGDLDVRETSAPPCAAAEPVTVAGG